MVPAEQHHLSSNKWALVSEADLPRDFCGLSPVNKCDPVLRVPLGHELGMLLHRNLVLHPATLPFIPYFYYFGVFFSFTSQNK